MASLWWIRNGLLMYANPAATDIFEPSTSLTADKHIHTIWPEWPDVMKTLREGLPTGTEKEIIKWR